MFTLILSKAHWIYCVCLKHSYIETSLFQSRSFAFHGNFKSIFISQAFMGTYVFIYTSLKRNEKYLLNSTEMFRRRKGQFKDSVIIELMYLLRTKTMGLLINTLSCLILCRYNNGITTSYTNYNIWKAVF